MKTKLILALLCAATAQAFPETETFLLPGNNVYCVGVPSPERPGYGMEGFFVLRTESELAQGIVTVPWEAGRLNNSAGITIVVASHFASVASLNAMGLKVGDPRLDDFGAIFTDVFGIVAPDTFGFAGGNFAGDFGIAGSPIRFVLDTGAHEASRMFTTESIAAGYRQYYRSQPLVRQGPDATGAGLLAIIGLWFAAHFRTVHSRFRLSSS
jgi:hypothetical protein